MLGIIISVMIRNITLQCPFATAWRGVWVHAAQCSWIYLTVISTDSMIFVLIYTHAHQGRKAHVSLSRREISCEYIGLRISTTSAYRVHICQWLNQAMMKKWGCYNQLRDLWSPVSDLIYTTRLHDWHLSLQETPGQVEHQEQTVEIMFLRATSKDPNWEITETDPVKTRNRCWELEFPLWKYL